MAPPSRSQIERIVALAIRAPSGDNCQPWSYVWDGAELSVLHDAARARHVLNHRGEASCLALGFALEALTIGAASLGFACEARLSVADPPARAWAAVRFEPGAAPNGDLAPAIEQRSADRRLYRGGSLPAGVLADLAADGALFPRARLSFAGRPSGELLRYLVAADAYVYDNEQVYLDIWRWMRFSEAEIEATRDGIPWRGLGLDVPEIPALRWTASRAAFRALHATRALWLSRLWVRRQLSSAAGLGCVAVPRGEAPAREDLVASGRLAFLTWLRLCRAGYGVQPLTVQSMPVYQRATGGLPPEVRPSFGGLYAEGERLLADAFGYAPDRELPVWLFRTGISPALPLDRRAKRLPLARVLSFEGAGV